MPNETIQKFGYPDRVIAEYTHWIILLRDVQNTAGCLVLACNEEATAMPEVSPAAWAEFPRVTEAPDVDHVLATPERRRRSCRRISATR